MDGFAVEPDSLYKSGEQYDYVSDQLRHIYHELTTALDQAGDFCGPDAAGVTYAKQYCPPALTQLHQMDQTHQSFQSMVDGVCWWAKNYVKIDDLVAESNPTSDA